MAHVLYQPESGLLKPCNSASLEAWQHGHQASWTNWTNDRCTAQLLGSLQQAITTAARVAWAGPCTTDLVTAADAVGPHKRCSCLVTAVAVAMYCC